MSVINADTQAFWQDMANQLGANRPYVGRRIVVTSGKHKGKEGFVTRHMKDRYGRDVFRYGGEANLHLREMEGRRGFVVMVDTGTERFWVKADKVDCLSQVEVK